MPNQPKPYEICPHCNRESESRMADQITRLMLERDRYKRALEFIEIAVGSEPGFLMRVAHEALWPGQD